MAKASRVPQAHLFDPLFDPLFTTKRPDRDCGLCLPATSALVLLLTLVPCFQSFTQIGCLPEGFRWVPSLVDSCNIRHTHSLPAGASEGICGASTRYLLFSAGLKYRRLIIFPASSSGVASLAPYPAQVALGLHTALVAFVT